MAQSFSKQLSTTARAAVRARMARRRREETTDRDSAHAAHAAAHAVLHEQHKQASQVAQSSHDDSSPPTLSTLPNSKQESNQSERALLKPNAIEPKTTNTQQTWSSEAPPLPYTADNRWSPTKQAVFQRRPRLSVGQLVLAKYYDSDEMYDGVVLQLNKDGNTFHVMFADGLEDPTVPAHNINVRTATPSSTAFHDSPAHTPTSSHHEPEREEHQPPHNPTIVDSDWGGGGGASISAVAAKAAAAVVTGSSSWMAARVQREREAWARMGEKNKGEEGGTSSQAKAEATSMALVLVLKSPRAL